MSLLRTRLPINIALSLILIMFAVPAMAATVEWDWQDSGVATDRTGAEMFSDILQSSSLKTEVAGRPQLPLVPLSFVIPAGEKVISVQLSELLTESVTLDEALPPFTGISSDNGALASVAGTGDSPLFPATNLLSWTTYHHRGISTAEIILAPYLYRESAAGVMVHQLISARIEIETAPDHGCKIPLRQRAADIASSRTRIAARVVNSPDLIAFAPSTQLRQDGGIFAPRGIPSVEGSGVDLVIICDMEHLETFQELADYKTVTGVPAVVRDTDWIRDNYPQGADLQETIRFFIQDAYEKWGISFLLLAGDTDVIPIRYVRSYFKEPPEDIPTDLYYAQLDGNWNADGDMYFGEAPFGGKPGDEVDFMADIFLGRMPVTDQASADLMVEKIITYSAFPDVNYTVNSTYCGEVLFPSNWQIGDPVEWITRNGADYCEVVIDNYQTDEIDELRLYETDWLYTDAYPETVSDVLNDFGTRAHLVHHVGHGFRYTMSMGNGSIVSTDILELENGLDHLMNMYALNCTSCAVDYACIGESFLLAPQGGGITCIGTLREAFPNTSLYYQNSYFGHLFSDSMTVGEAFTRSHNDWATLAQVEGSHRWTQLGYILIGDPTINIWLKTPQELTVNLAQPFDLDSDTLQVQVERLGTLLPGALVVASMAGQDRAMGETDELGFVTLPFHAEETGRLEINVVSRNNIPWAGGIDVLAGSAPCLSLDRIVVLDDPGGDASQVGNADSLLDAGETVRLEMWLHNRGAVTADNITLDLSIPGGELVVSEGHFDIPQSLAAGDSLELTGLFLLDAPLALVDGSGILLDFAIAYDDGVSADRLDLTGHAPLPRLLSFYVNDPAGDGDGEPDDGETYDLMPEWKNYGSTILAGWTAEIVALDPAGTVISGTVSIPVLEMLERGASAGFTLSESDVSTPNNFEITLTGPLGGTAIDTITVRRPDAPTNIFLDASFASTIIDMSWNIPVAGNSPAGGYLVYRSQNEGGPYELASTEPTRHSYYRNSGLEESTYYYFVVESVDSSGYRSVFSDESAISTNPSMLDGWPLGTGAGSASSVAIGDIDGDGDKELVAGSSLLYAWHHDGVEVIDGDENSSTYGVISADGGSFTASIAMADVDINFPGLEVIAAATDPFQICVVNALGENVAGWPQTMPHWCWATPAAADVDLDGEVEIFVVCLNGNVYAWNHDGSSLIEGAGGIFAGGLGGWSRSSTSLAQLDDDPELEIVVGSAGANSMMAWNHDGTVLSGWPVNLGGEIHSSPSVADIDDDGLMEIVILCENDSLYVLRNNGSFYGNGFPIYLESNAAGLAPSAALVDFEDDGQMEIVAASVESYHSSYITIVDNMGNVMPGWPIHLEDSSEGSPVVADLDHDESLEVLLGSENGYLYAWELDGTFMAGFPILTKAEVRSTPTIDDIDGDLTVDIALLGWDANVYVWDMPDYYWNSLAHWKMFRANVGRTGVFTREEQIVGVSDDGAVPGGGAKLFANFPNPFNPTTNISFITPVGGGVQVTLSIHDVQGRKLRTLVDQTMAGGEMHEVTWDGRDDSKRAVASGVYFSRVEIGEKVLSRKMVLLK